MIKNLIGNAIVGQSGGPTSAINATLAGVIKGAFLSNKIEKIYGMRNGIEGFLAERLADLTEQLGDGAGNLNGDKLDMLVHTPAAALGSCRRKLPDPHADAAFYEKLIALFKKYNIRYFFYIGGNDSMDTVAKVSEYLKNCDYEMYAIGVPKTIDNDLMATDHTPGFGSAAKFIATTMQEIVRDCAVYTVPAVTVVEIMGRDAGWLTASAALADRIAGCGPDYVYLPEMPFSLEDFFEDIREAMKKKPNIVIAVSEGVRFADGRYVGEGTQSGSVDAFGHKYLGGTGAALEMAVKAEFGCKVRSVELNLPQRCAAHCASQTDLDESVSTGFSAVNAAVSGISGSMISIVRGEGKEYTVSFEAKPISEIANKVRSVPRHYINERGNDVTEECINYILPLIQGEPVLQYKNGLPVHFVIR